MMLVPFTPGPTGWGWRGAASLAVQGAETNMDGFRGKAGFPDDPIAIPWRDGRLPGPLRRGIFNAD